MNKYIIVNCGKCYKGKEQGVMRENSSEKNLDWRRRLMKSFCDKETLKLEQKK